LTECLSAQGDTYWLWLLGPNGIAAERGIPNPGHMWSALGAADGDADIVWDGAGASGPLIWEIGP
jgi:hypothetical protein